MVSQWWRRATAVAKDKQTLCLTRLSGRPNPDMEAAVVRATSHDELTLDYKNARRVFTWARTSPSSFLHPLMWSIARRASRTRCWAVALKSLLLAHGLLLQSSSDAAPGRLPFDLSGFHDRSSRYWGQSAFVQAYFNFLDNRSLFLGGEDELERVERLQSLLELLIQIRPYADGMEAALIREAMDCALIEIFEVYSGICNGIASFLVGYMDGGGSTEEGAEESKRKGLLGIRIVRRASEQSDQLAAYFELCQRLEVPNAAGLPPVERIPEEDIRNLEKVVMKCIPKSAKGGEEKVVMKCIPKSAKGSEETKAAAKLPNPVVTENWVVFEDDERKRWASMVQQRDAACGYEIGDLIEL